MNTDSALAKLFSSNQHPIRALLPEAFRAEFMGVELWQYISLGLLIAVSLVARKVIHFVVMNRVRKLGEALGQRWMMRLVDVFASPGATLVMAVLLRISYPALGLPEAATEFMSILVRILIVVAISWAIYQLVDVLADRMAEKATLTESKLDDQLVPLMRKSLKVVTVVGGVLFVLENMHVDVGSLIAGLGIGGLAFAFAAKDTLANFFGSVMIFVDRPFQIGDWIVVKNAEGIVEEVGFRTTRIRTFYNSLITMPNAAFTDSQIDNYGARTYRRTSVTLGLTYDTSAEKVQAFVEGVRAIIEANPTTRKDYFEVHFAGFGAHSLNIMLYFFFRVDSWSEELAQRHNVYLEILRLAESLGVRFAFPTQTVHVESMAQARSVDPPSETVSSEQLAQIINAYGPGGERSLPSTPKLAAKPTGTAALP